MPETVAFYVPQPDGTMRVEVTEEFHALARERGDFVEMEQNGPPDEDGRIPLRVKA